MTDLRECYSLRFEALVKQHARRGSKKMTMEEEKMVRANIASYWYRIAYEELNEQAACCWAGP